MTTFAVGNFGRIVQGEVSLPRPVGEVLAPDVVVCPLPDGRATLNDGDTSLGMFTNPALAEITRDFLRKGRRA